MSIEKFKILETITLLYIEDDIENLEEMQKVLNRFFKQVYIAKDGEEGLNQFKLQNPDIILTDVHMPNVDGIDMIKNIKKIDKKVPIVIASAFNEEELFDRLANIHIDKFLVKPIDLRKLLNIILDLIKNLKMEKL